MLNFLKTNYSKNKYINRYITIIMVKDMAQTVSTKR